jgi:hypothetical protein
MQFSGVSQVSSEIGKHVSTITEWLNTHIHNLTGVQPATLARSAPMRA